MKWTTGILASVWRPQARFISRWSLCFPKTPVIKATGLQLDPQELSVRELYSWMVQLITPRPIAWVSSHSKDGVANLAPYSFFNGVGANPPLIMFCPANNRLGEAKDTLQNVRQNGEFVVNMVTEAMAEQMNQTAAEYGPELDEFVAAGVSKADSIKVQVPRVETVKQRWNAAFTRFSNWGRALAVPIW